MNIIVPIKQVPATDNVKMDPETGTMVRSGQNAVVNPLDLYALEAALQLAEKHDGTVTALSMGPPAAMKALREALALGCDKAALISDRKFGGADTWATSYVIAKCIETMGDYDLVICGERATDGDTGQVGPGMAAWLDLPLATYVTKIEVTDAGLDVERLVEIGYQKLSMTKPALLTVVKEIADPRLPTLDGKKKAMKAEIPVYNTENMDVDPRYIGLKGSPTKVVKIEAAQVTRGGKTVKVDGNAPEVVAELVEYLKEKELV